ncbi:IKZF [Mytilus coruscus]|uniref:IKZF n=1 Tax=Mytilus coruscus TaxID=42192 RepID=A0A6J8E2R9_MYTCO|nr:IKZF [Mytilus coruscus]
MNLSGSSMAEIPNSKFTDSSPYSNFNSLFSHPTSVAMSNALFMNYHNQAMAGASLPSLYSLHSTSEIPPPSAGFDTSSQSPQKDALNLSVHKQDAGTDNEIPSPTSISRSRSRSLSGSESIKNDLMGTSLKIDCSDIGIQVKSCCKMGMDIPLMMGACSPSDNASIQSGDSAATLAALENSPDNIASLLAAGKLYKCEPCECYFSEYAMYRIHSKIHPGGKSLPFSCPICSEDCHDKVYFSLHVSEHLQ